MRRFGLSRVRVWLLAVLGMGVLGGGVGDAATASSGRDARPGALRTVPVAKLPLGRVRSHRGRLFVPVSAQAAAVRPGVGAAVGREITGLRTATSRTFAAAGGEFETRVYPFAVNYRRPGGGWAAISNRLVADAQGGYRNQANSFSVHLPRAGSGAVRFQDGRAWISLALSGGEGTARVAGNEERFAAALPGVEVANIVGNLALEQSLTLHGTQAPRSFSYLIRASAGLAARRQADGTVAFVDRSGATRVAIAPARMWAQSTPTDVRAVTTTLARVAGGWRLTLSPDHGFVDRVLAAGGSVVIDPTISPGNYVYINGGEGSFGDCQLTESTPTTSRCGGTVDYVSQSASDADHTLWRFDIADSVPRNAEVLESQLSAPIASDPSAAGQVGVYQVTQAWTQSATWSTYDGTNAWATPGGDTAASPSDQTQIGTSASTGYWVPTGLVQGWVDGTIPNNGLMLKAVGSGNLAEVGFDSSFSSTPPFLGVRYEPRLGDYRGYTLDSQQITDRSSLGVNVADGNLLVSNNDVEIAGTAGDDLQIGRYYNNLDPTQGAFGRGWVMTPGADTELSISGDAKTVYYRGASGNAESFSWNGSSWISPAGLDAVLSQTSGTTWSLHFNSSGITEKFTGPGGYNVNAQLTSVVDRNGNTISYAYNTSGQLSSITDTQGRKTTVTYNTAGYVSTITDSSGRVWKYVQNSSGELTSYVDPAGNTTTYGYDSHGNLAQITTPAGNIVQFGYAGDDSGDNRVTSVTRLVKPTDSSGPTRSYAYYTGGSPCSASDEGRTVETNELGYQTTYCYAASDNVTKTVDPDGHVQSTSYTADDNVATLTNAMGGVLTLGYENQGTTSERLTSIQQGTTGPETTLAYNDPNNAYSPSQVTDPEGRSVSYAYDSPGNAHTITDQLASQNQATLDHNPDGTISDSIDANGNKTMYDYTGGNLTEIDPPDQTHLGDTKITYDSLSRPIKVIDGKGQERDYTYDKLDRVKTVVYKNASGTTVATFTYSYDADGNLIKRIGPAGTTTYTYDGLDRVTADSYPDGSSDSYGYDAASNLKTLTDAAGTVSYIYNKENLPTQITDPAGTTNLAYNADGNRTQISYPNGASISYGYAPDNSGRLTSITDNYTASGGGQASQSFAYSYTDPSGRDTSLWQSVTDQAGNTTTYSYDALDRLTEALTKNAAGATTADYRYTLDGDGNLLQETSPGGTTSYAYNADNQTCWSYAGASSSGCASPPSGAHVDSYDLDGNLTSNGNGLTLAYNALNQTTALNGIPYKYWGEGQDQRVGGGNATFTYDLLGLSSRSEYGDTISLTRDPSGAMIDQRGSSSGTYYPLYDGQGSIIGLTDTGGHLANSYSYDPNGNRTTSTGTAPSYWGYQGGYMVDNGLYHYGARYYNPATSSWTQPDPLNQLASLTQNDRYTYAGNDPINLNDPSGLCFIVSCSTYHAIGEYASATQDLAEGLGTIGLGGFAFGVCEAGTGGTFTPVCAAAGLEVASVGGAGVYVAYREYTR